MDDEQCIACNSDDIPCREHGRYDDAAHEGEARAAVRANECRERCLEEIRKNGLRIAFDAARKFGEMGRENSRLRAVLTAAGKVLTLTSDRLGDAEAENARLREELDMARDGAELWSDAATKHDHARLAAEATIARVHSVLEDMESGLGEEISAAKIRAALKGDTP